MFIDQNKNGKDDRYEDGNNEGGFNTTGSKAAENSKNRKNIYGAGLSGLRSIFDQYGPSSDDDPSTKAMKDAYAFDTMSSFRNFQMGKAAGQYQSGISKDMMKYQYGLDQLGKSQDRQEIFGYNMRSMDKQYELQNLYANQQYGRDIGMLSATGVESRKNMRQQGVENRLQTITEGEQNRLGIAATGDQTRRNTRTQGTQDRALVRTQGGQDRALVRTQGDETRRNTRTQGSQDRALVRTKGDEERKTYDQNDMINARTEERSRARSKALARSF